MKRILLYTGFVFITHLVNAQEISSLLLKSKNVEFIENAMSEAFFIVRQDYQLKDNATGELFGRGGKNEFGTVFSLGIKVEGGYYINERVVQPWEYDARFDRYRQSHTPVVYKTFYKEIGGNPFNNIELIDRPRTELVQNKFYQVMDQSIFNGDGLTTDETRGIKNGWLIWVEADKSLEQADTAKVSYIIHRSELNIDESRKSYNINTPSTDKQLWGGVFVQSVKTAIGQITFKLVGLLDKKDDKWFVIIPFIEKPATTVNTKTEDDSDELVPVVTQENNTKKNKKK